MAENVGSDIMKWVMFVTLGFIFVAVLTHAAGFSLAAGTLFSGLNTTGQTLEGGNIASGGQKVK